MMDLIADVIDLCKIEVDSIPHAQEVLSLIEEILTPELMNLSYEQHLYLSNLITHSPAYKLSPPPAADQLLETDILQYPQIDFLSLILLQSPPPQPTKICDIIFTYRFTKPLIVAKYLKILTQTLVNDYPPSFQINDHLLAFLVSSLSTNEQLTKPVLKLLLLVHQHSPPPQRSIIISKFNGSNAGIGNLLVMMLNRASTPAHKQQVLSFLHNLMHNPPTKDLFYTNDLIVLLQIILREIEEQGPAIQPEFLEVLECVLDSGILCATDEKLKLAVFTCLKHLSNDNTDSQNVILRCLDVPEIQPKRRPPPPPPRSSYKLHNKS